MTNRAVHLLGSGLLLFLALLLPAVAMAEPQLLSPLMITTTSLPTGTVSVVYNQSLAASGGVLGYTWSVIGGALPSGTAMNSSGMISGTPRESGIFHLTVRVRDDLFATDTQPLVLTINPAPPVIATSSLPGGTVNSAYSQTLAASGGTPPYTWTLASGASLPAGLNLAPGGVISGVPSAAGPSTFTVRLTDANTSSVTASLSITISPQALAITTTSLPAGIVGNPYSQALAAAGGKPPYSWALASGSSLPAGLNLMPGGMISGAPNAAGTTSFTVRVTDSASATANATLSITINPAPLVVTTSTLQAGVVNSAYSQTLAASGGKQPYAWALAAGSSLPSGLNLSAGGTISGTPSAAGAANFTVRVTDSASGAATAALSITINAAPLVITTSTLPAGTVSSPYSQALAASGGTPPYTWALAAGSSLPAGLNLSAGGTVSGTPSAAGTISFTVRVTDSATTPAKATATAQLSITINPAALAITTSSLPSGIAGNPYSQNLAANGGTPPYSWSLTTASSLPAGLNLSAGGTISGTPSAAGSTTFTVRVTDSAQISVTGALPITINPPALGITTSSLPAGMPGAAYSQTLTAAGGTLPYSWALTSGSSLPAGLTLSAGGTISGTPSAAGTTNFTVRVTDSGSATAIASLSITINPPTLTITTTTLPAGTVNVAYSQALAAAGGTLPYSWALASGSSLPAGLNLSAGGTISGTPSAAGMTNFTVRVTDSASGAATAALSITITPPALTVTSSSLPGGIVNVAYSQALAASGGTLPYSWALASGSSLPAGLNLSAGGTISGTPSAAGTTNFTVRVTDSASGAATAALSITINPPALTVTSSSLPGGVVNAAYSQTLAASGGTAPYSWALASGSSLPAGLNLSAAGTISGTPSAAGTTNFTVRVTDSASGAATAALSIKINPPGLAVTTASLPAGSVGAAYSQALAASGGTPPYSWALASGSSLPAGLNLAAGGTISGTPATAGSTNFTVRVTDSASASATAALLITINAPALTITTSTLPQGTVGVAYSQSLAATGGAPPYSWSVTAGSLGAGLTMSPAGAITGTPTTSGTFTFTAQASDSAGIKSAQSLTLQVQSPKIQITTATLPSSTIGSSYSQTLTASGGTTPYAWYVLSGALPPGFVLNQSGIIQGLATTAGSYSVMLQVRDNTGAVAALNYLLTINGAITITTTSLADALLGAAYAQPLRASGGTPPYTWSVTAGALPDGIKLDATGGTLSGTPTAVGTFTFTLRATDSVRAFTEHQFQMKTAAGLIITTAPVLPPGTVGLQYSQTLTAAGGTAPYLWSISSGGLPAGVSLNSNTGAITGSPSATGSFQFTVNVSDSLARTTTKQFTLPVAATLVISSAPQLPAATAGVAYSQTLTATGGTPPYLWNITTGGLPSGLSFDSATGAIAGIPSLGGSFTFTTQVSDSNSVTATKQFTLAVQSNLAITTTSPLPGAVAGTAYQQSLAASGGVLPYVFSVKSGSLPPGLVIDLSSSGLTGTPTANGAYAFTLQVSDGSGGATTKDFTLTVALPPLPAVNITGLPDPAGAANQPTFGVSLASAYPVQLSGQIVMTFAPDAEAPVDDGSIQFSTGGRTVNFTIPAGSTSAVLPAGQMALQTGTVAGAINLNLSLQSAKNEVNTTSSLTLHVLRAAPTVTTMNVVHTSGGFELHILGYSTPRQITQAVVQLTPAGGANLQTSQLTIPLSSLATAWYQSAPSAQFGSQFSLVIPFTIQGNSSGIGSVGLTLVNNQGSSASVSSQF